VEGCAARAGRESAQARLAQLEQERGRTPADDHAALDRLHALIRKTRVTAEQEAAAQRDQACARELGEADNAVAAAERVCHERKLRAFLERRSTAAAHMQEAFAALRGAAAKVDAAENEIQLFLQTEATEGEKPALRQLRHTLAQRLARNLHASGVIEGRDAASGNDVVDLAAHAKAQAASVLRTLSGKES